MINPYPETIWESAHLKLFGWFKRGEDFFIYCEKHGMVKGYIHGFESVISCPKCVKESWKNG